LNNYFDIFKYCEYICTKHFQMTIYKKLRIHISSYHKKMIRDEFNTSKQSVQLSLDYVFNSKRAKAIRQRARVLLQEEVNKIDTIKID